MGGPAGMTGQFEVYRKADADSLAYVSPAAAAAAAAATPAASSLYGCILSLSLGYPADASSSFADPKSQREREPPLRRQSMCPLMRRC